MPYNGGVEIIKARERDLETLRGIFSKAIAFMRSSGNLSQWDDFPSLLEKVKEDICKERLYVFLEKERAVGAFCLLKEPEPTYAKIKGRWGSNGPYLTIHRLASDGTCHGLLSSCLAFVKGFNLPIRIDTHQDNAPMRKALEKEGFLLRGTIHLEDGSPRLAFDLV